VDKKSKNKSWLKKLIYVLLIVEISYVVVLNAALQLPVTQTLINKIKPEKFHISWESAWTWYPFRVHVQNATGNGQARSQQWEFEVESVSASIDILPLIFKRVWINDVQVSDARYYQRPRLKPDKDYSELIEFFPPISGREITDAVTTPKKKKRAWHVDIEGIELNGQYDYWIMQFRGQAKGTLEADLDVVSRGGLFSLTIPQVDLELGTHYINGKYELLQHGRISGELGMAPMVPRENKSIKILQYISLDADINIDVNSLAFINLFTHGLNAMKVDGMGLVDGRLRIDRGSVIEGTDLSVDANNIQVNVLSQEIEGDGTIEIKVSPEKGGLLEIDLSNGKWLQEHESMAQIQDVELMLTAQIEDMSLEKKNRDYELSFKVPTALVKNVSVFNSYFPPNSPFQFIKGTAGLTADILLKTDDADGYVKLKADDIEMIVDEQLISAGFNADIALVGGVPGLMSFDISGSEFRLDNVQVTGENQEFNEKDWAVVLTLEKADTIFSKPLVLNAEAILSMTDSRPIVAMLGNEKKRPQWVNNMLTVENIQGKMELQAANDQIVIPYMFIDSDNIDFGAKGVIEEATRNGVVYARYKKLDLVVKISDGKKNIDIIRAKGKFDEYQPPRYHD